jgi:hypothetical protein
MHATWLSVTLHGVCRVLEKADQGAEWLLYVLLGEHLAAWDGRAAAAAASINKVAEMPCLASWQ